MTDSMSPESRSKLMSRVKGKDTAPELALRKAVWALGLRYRIHQKIGSVRPDMLFKGARVAIFIDGCFWHCCPLHGTIPKDNSAFWLPKLKRNVQRDMENTQALTAEEWSVLRFWEHEIDESAEACAHRIATLVAARQGKSKVN